MRTQSRIRYLMVLFTALLLAAVCAPALGDQEQIAIKPGIYHYGELSSCELRPLPDGSWQVLFWQGVGLDPAPGGFSFLGRGIYDANRGRLALNWQSLPSSCCPGRGRGELLALGPDSFKFNVFAPALNQGAWPVLGDAEFQWVAEPRPQAGSGSLAGQWRLFLWYEDLLPQGKPSDQVYGQLDVLPETAGGGAIWQGRPGRLSFTQRADGLDLAYRDEAAAYELNASLRPLAGGLAYAGRFNSTLGRGGLRIVRAGLPAEPPGAGNASSGKLSGTWVDPRTGSDFFDIKGSSQGFDFISYGGSRTRPRYLTKGSARPLGAGRFEAVARDVEGYCCGNQGRLVFMEKGDKELEVRALWWPKGQPEPQGALGQPYVIRKVKAGQSGQEFLASPGGRWPLVRAPLPGLMAVQAGSVRVRFTWLPQSGERDYTLFSQGGYLRDFDLFVNSQGLPAARLTTQEGELLLTGRTKVEPEKPHDIWLIYQAGGKINLYLDNKLAAQKEMPANWVGSNSPYLVGGSRWPGRSFEGRIESAELWTEAQAPDSPTEPTLVIKPSPAPTPEATRESAKLSQREITRMWNPVRLIHAYAVSPEQISLLKKEGYQVQGPVGKLAAKQEEGTKPLFAFRHRGLGYFILAQKAQAPPGCDSLGIMGYIWTHATPETTKLEQLSASFPEPVRGGRSQDVYYTSRPENAQAAGEAGYRDTLLVGYVRPVKEPDFSPPVLYDWGGSWRGEGWGRFFIQRSGNELNVFWYYGRLDSPHYFGRYRLEPGGRKAGGTAVGGEGDRAAFYRQELSFVDNLTGGPSLRVKTWRLAAPTDDGKLVRFSKSAPKESRLLKTAQQVPFEEKRILSEFAAKAKKDPALELKAALGKAGREGKLVER